MCLVPVRLQMMGKGAAQEGATIGSLLPIEQQSASLCRPPVSRHHMAADDTASDYAHAAENQTSVDLEGKGQEDQRRAGSRSVEDETGNIDFARQHRNDKHAADDRKEEEHLPCDQAGLGAQQQEARVVLTQQSDHRSEGSHPKRAKTGESGDKSSDQQASFTNRPAEPAQEAGEEAAHEAVQDPIDCVRPADQQVGSEVVRAEADERALLKSSVVGIQTSLEHSGVAGDAAGSVSPAVHPITDQSSMARHQPAENQGSNAPFPIIVGEGAEKQTVIGFVTSEVCRGSSSRAGPTAVCSLAALRRLYSQQVAAKTIARNTHGIVVGMRNQHSSRWWSVAVHCAHDVPWHSVFQA